MSDTWDDYAAGWDDNPDVIRYAQLAFESLAKRYDVAGLTILDFGCGTGLLTQRLAKAGAKVVALDRSEKMVQVLLAKNLESVQAFACDLTAHNVDQFTALHQGFDLIVASSVCGFLDDFDGTLNVLTSLLKPKGLFIQWDWMRSEAEPDSGFDAQNLTPIYQRANLIPISIEEAFALSTDHGKLSVVMGVAQK
ncbi:MAG: class I SAM-dependent methyltransferase [Bermanella sp.]